MRTLQCFQFFSHKKLKKTPQKVAYLWQLGFFFSAAPTAQNSPELHFGFINSFIQPSLVGSLHLTYCPRLDTFFLSFILFSALNLPNCTEEMKRNGIKFFLYGYSYFYATLFSHGNVFKKMK